MKKFLITILTLCFFFNGQTALATNTYATVLNGTTQYWNIADVSQTGLDGMTNLTIEFWVNFSTLPINQGRTFAITKWSNSVRSYSVDFNPGADGNNKMRFQVTSDVTNFTTATSNGDAVSATGTWYHMALTFTGATKTIVMYVNGSSIALTHSVQNAGSVQDGDAPFRVSTDGEATTEYYLPASVDDVRIWNDVRSAAQIAANYNCSLDGTETGLVGYWRFDNNGNDSTANANNLTNVNSATFTNTGLPFTNSCTVAAAPIPQDSYQIEEE